MNWLNLKFAAPNFVFVLFLFCSTFGHAASSDSLEHREPFVYEKVYLHIDRELYAPGDDVWFKSYLVGGINNKLIPGYKNIYVQLISDSGKVVQTRLLLSNDGTAKGDFHLPRSLPEGEYTIRAHTKYQKNFGPESYFHAKIAVKGSKTSDEINSLSSNEKPLQIDISFLPEGGSFVLNAINHVAFKAIDQNGKGVAVKGTVVDENGKEVVPFKSSYKGMDKFIIMPQEDKYYFAKVEGFPDFNYRFEPASPDGVCLNYKPDGNYLLFTLTRNLKINTPQNLLLKATHKGIGLFNSQITMNGFQHAQRLFKGLFPLGISKITLYGETGKILAERLVFVQNEKEQTIEIELDKQEYKTREKVEINLSTLLAKTDTIESKLSVAVVHEDYFGVGGNSQNIKSYLLLDSELKGGIESPADFFVDENGISSNEKLDLMMLVNGWRNYYWEELSQFRGDRLENWADYGLSIAGTVTKQWGGKPVDGGQVVIGPFSSSFLIEKTRTDENGYFKFDKLYLKDSALIMINAETKNGSNRTDLSLDTQFQIPLKVDAKMLQNCCPDISVPMKFYRENYYRLLANREFKVKTGILLDDVTAIGQKIIGDGHFRLYGEADISLEITDDDQTYFSILDYLEMKSLPGIVVSGDGIRIRSGRRNPLLLVDGLDTDWSDIINIPMGDIDKIEILKTGYGMAAYGSRGGDGVISVLTKMGKGEWENNWQRIVHGRITPTVRGFQQAREFYSPKYTATNLNDDRPDFRPTLLWEPEVAMENGNATVEFFTSDKLARYHIVVEGISKNGKICYATNLMTVSIRRN